MKTELAFPGMSATDTVVREGQALVQRYRLLRRLEDDDGIRRDLRGAPPEPGLVAEMRRQLVPGVDAPLASRDATWPIPAGVRLETLYASPWLAGQLGGTDCHALPRTAAEFAGLFEGRTGIDPYSDAMDRNFRITPFELGQIYEEVCGMSERPSHAGLLLASRHFDEADAADAARAASNGAGAILDTRRKRLRFRRPLIEGFRLLAELERGALIVEDLGRLNLLSVADIRIWLDDADVRPLAQALADHPELRRLFDYQMIGTDALGGFDNANGRSDDGGRDWGDDGGDASGEARDYVPLATSLRVGAAARGRLDADVVTALTDKGERARVLLRAAFTDRIRDTRASGLVNDEPALFYGLNRTLAGAFVADLGKAFEHGDTAAATGAEHERQALLADTIVAAMDPKLHARHLGRTARLGASPLGRQPSGTNRQRDAIAHARLMLPGRDTLGSAGRANAALWSDRWGDEALWRVFLDRRLGNLPLDLDEDERAAVASAFDRLEALFGATLDAGCNDDDIAGRADAVRAACDLATAVSAVSTNRAVAAAIQAWLHAYDFEKDRPARRGPQAVKQHGRRLNPGVLHALRVRKKKGVPSAGILAKGTPRNRRSATRKKQALLAGKE